MTRRRLQRSALLFLLLLAALVAVPVVATWGQVQQERLNHALISAAIQNDASKVRFLLQQGASPNAFFAYNDRSIWQRALDLIRTALHRPVPSYPSDGDSVLMSVMELDGYDGPYNPVIEALLDAGADPNTVSTRLSTPLKWAIGRRQRKTLQALFRHHVDVNLCDKFGGTALMCAAAKTDPEMVETLLHRGAEISMKDRDGHTALWCALRSGPLVNASDVVVSDESIRATVACLLHYGASVKGRDREGKTLLEREEEWDHDPQLIQILKRAGAK